MLSDGTCPPEVCFCECGHGHSVSEQQWQGNIRARIGASSFGSAHTFQRVDSVVVQAITYKQSHNAQPLCITLADNSCGWHVTCSSALHLALPAALIKRSFACLQYRCWRRDLPPGI